MDFKLLKEKDKTYIANTYNRFELDVLSGKGVVCENTAGQKFIDFSSGIGVNSLGFSNEHWIDAVKSQIDKLSHISNLYYTTPQVELAEKLCKLSEMERVFFANSGAEANEGAIKTARKYSSDKYGDNRYEIITLKNSFHGRTIATLSATGQDVFHKYFGPFVDGFLYGETNNLEDIEKLVSDKTAAIMVECIQGEGGVIPLTTEFLAGIQKLCNKKDVLLIIDEVQTGVGRTGSFLCFQQYPNIKPDIVTLAKGLGGGLPIGAVLFGQKTKDTLGFSDHGTTFGGNPIVTAGAVAVLDCLTDNFIAEVAEKGAYLKDQLENITLVESVTGKGLMLGIKLRNNIKASEVISLAAKKGVILLSAKDKLRMLPPLNISRAEIDKGLKIIKEVLTKFEGE